MWFGKKNTLAAEKKNFLLLDPKLVIYGPTRSVREPKFFFSIFLVDHSKTIILGEKIIKFG